MPKQYTAILFLALFISSFHYHLSAQTHTPITINVSTNCRGYWEYLPVNYNGTTTKYPIIIYIHGGGSYGSGTASALQSLLTNEGIAYYINQNQFPSTFSVNGSTTSFIVISPQFTQKPGPLEVKQVIDYMLQRYRVDAARVYLTGYSVGGDVAWKVPYNLANATRLAALCPVAGYNRDPYIDTTAQFIAGANLPVWAIHSNSDAAVPVQASIDMVNKINSFNPATTAILTRLSNITHENTVRVAFDPQFRPNGKSIYEWFLTYNRSYPPIADAGADASITLPLNSVTLNGSNSSDPEKGALSYSWSKIAGPSQYTLNSTNIANPVVSNLVAGVYSFRLAVTDISLLTTVDTVKITVVNPNPNKLPVANAGNNQSIVLPQTSVSLSGSNSYDPDGIIETYSWTKISGPSQYTITSPSSVNTTVTNLKAGTYRFRLTVTDNEGGSNSSDVDITVVNPFPNVAPVANAGPHQSIELPLNSVTLNGSSSSDADGVIVAYQWKQITGPSTSVITNPSSVSTTAGNLVLGTYKFELRVTDDSSATAKDTIQVIVNPIPPTVSQKFIKVNVYGGTTPAGTGWNSWNLQTTLASGVLKYSDGTSSTVSASLSAHTNIGDNGSGYPTTMCPPEVGRTASYSTVARTLTLSGLDNTKRYDLEVYASRIGGNPTKFTIGTSSITIQTDKNYTNKAVFTNLIPSAGKIVLAIDVVITYSYINGFTLTENTTAPANASPVCVAGSNQTINQPTSQATLNGSSSYDPDGTIATYNWQQVSGPSSATITSPASTTTIVTGLTALGNYVFQLTVIDNSGYSSSSQVTITVSPPPNQAPVASAGSNQAITLPLSQVNLDASASSDPDGSVVSYNWTKQSGPSSFSFSNAATSKPTVSNLVAGTYVFKVTVTDDRGGTAFADVTVIVNPDPANQSPFVNAGVNEVITLPVNSVQLSGSASDPDNNPITYLWSLVSGPSQYSISNTGILNPTVSSLVSGVYVFRLTVTDNSGAVSYDDVSVTVNSAVVNQPPVANAGTNQVITLPVSQVSLSASASTDADGSIVSYSWIKQSGPSSYSFSSTSVVNPVVSGLVQGVYVFRVTVTDNGDASSFADVTVTVNAAVGTTRYVRVNIYGGSNAYANSQWNDWNVGGGATPLSSGALKYDDGTVSTVNAALSNQSIVVDNGSGYATTMCPSQVGRTASYYTASRTLTLSGLDNTKQYSLELYASRNSTASGVTRFTVGTTSVNIATDNNFTNKASFTALSATTSGQLVVTITNLNTFNYINGFTLTEITTGSAPPNVLTDRTDRRNLILRQETGLELFPNPANETFNLLITNSYLGNITVEIIGTDGVIKNSLVFTKNSENPVKLSVSTNMLNQGLYIVKTKMKGWTSEKRLMIMK